MDQLSFRSIFFTYCLEVQADGSFVALNRNYKPVGFATKKYIEYQDFPVSFKFKDLTKTTIQKLNSRDEPFEIKPGEKLYLYTDACSPLKSTAYMQAYLEKMSILMRLQINSEH